MQVEGGKDVHRNIQHVNTLYGDHTEYHSIAKDIFVFFFL